MNIEKIIEEIKKEGEEELRKLKEENDKEIEKINLELSNELKDLEKKWVERIEKEKKSLIEKKENELKLELDLTILKKKNEVLNEFFDFIIKKLDSISTIDKKKFYKKEIIKVIDSGDELIHFDKKSLNDVFDASFKIEIVESVKSRLGKCNIRFIEDNETFIEGKGFISRITLKDKFKELWENIILDISKRIFEEDETKV